MFLRRGAWLVAAAVLAGGEAAAETDDPQRTATVASGQTLSRIAQDHLGDASLWPAIYLANRDQIKDPARIYPGQRLTVPAVATVDRQSVREQAIELLRR